MFQPQAPVSVPNITDLSITAASMMPLPIVLATWRLKKKNAIKLRKAAHTIAMRGERTRDDGRELDKVFVNAGDLVDLHPVGYRVEHVDYVVELLRERVYVLAVERRDECLVQAVEDVVGDVVAPVLDVVHRLRLKLLEPAPGDEAAEVGRRVDRAVHLPVEKVEEVELSGEKDREHRGLLSYFRGVKAQTAIILTYNRSERKHEALRAKARSFH